jgi:hypothetical protein
VQQPVIRETPDCIERFRIINRTFPAFTSRRAATHHTRCKPPIRIEVQLAGFLPGTIQRSLDCAFRRIKEPYSARGQDCQRTTVVCECQGHAVEILNRLPGFHVNQAHGVFMPCYQ